MDVFDATSQIGADLVFVVSESDTFSSIMLLKAFSVDGRYTIVRAGPGHGYAELHADKEFAELGRRLFIVEGLKADDVADVASALASLQKGDCVLLKVPGSLSRNKVLQEYMASSFIRKITAPEVKPWEVNEWVSARLRDKGASFPATLPVLLASTVGNDLVRLEMEMDKLILVTGGKLFDGAMRHVNRDGGEIFQAMLESLAAADVAAFMSRAHALGEVIPVCRFMAKRLSELNAVSVFIGSNRSVDEAATETGLNAFLIRRSYVPSARSIGRVKILKGLREFPLLEQRVKESPQVDQWKLLEATFLKVVT